MIYLGDCLYEMRKMTSASVDLIYLDPPYNTGRTWKGNAGSFDDKFAGRNEYLDFMEDRLSQCWRILKNTGSIYLHCDPTYSHYLKVAMDRIFYVRNFRNEIVWCYARGGANPRYGCRRAHDTILYYSKGEHPTWNVIYRPYSQAKLSRYNKDDKRTPEELERIHKRGKVAEDWWDDIPSFSSASRSGEISGYPTQKPLALLRRIIKASSNAGDVVLDPFCGSGTTLVAAKELGRKFIGIDANPDAIAVAKRRLI